MAYSGEKGLSRAVIQGPTLKETLTSLIFGFKRLIETSWKRRLKLGEQVFRHGRYWKMSRSDRCVPQGMEIRQKKSLPDSPTFKGHLWIQVPISPRSGQILLLLDVSRDSLSAVFFSFLFHWGAQHSRVVKSLCPGVKTDSSSSPGFAAN